MKVWLFVVLAGVSLLFSVAVLSEEPVTVKMVYWPGPEADAMSKVINWYNENVTPTSGIQVKMILFGREGFFEREATLLAAGSSEVDMIFTTSYILNQQAPFLENLNPYFADPKLNTAKGDPNIIIPRARKSFEIGGELKGVVMDGSITVLLYRKDLMEKLLSDTVWQQTYREIARRELGRDLLPKPVEEWTWDDFLATALFFSKKQNPASPTTYGTALQAKAMWPNANVWSPVLKSCGGSWFVNGKPAFDTAVGHRALDIYRIIAEKGATSSQCITYEYMEPNEAMRSGEVAMILQWSVAYNELSDKKTSPLVWNKIGIAPYPAGDVEHSVWLTTMGVGLSKYSKHKKEAFKWLSFLSTPKAQQMYGANGGVPAVRSVLNELAKQNPLFGYVADYINQYAYYENAGSETLSAERIIAQYISSVASLKMTVGEAAAAIDRDIEQLMEKK